VQAKGGKDKLSIVQIEQDHEIVSAKVPKFGLQSGRCPIHERQRDRSIGV
jgi:hypothetical protein